MRHHQEIIPRDDGRFQIGLCDDGPGPFESRAFALAVSGYSSPVPAPTAKFRRFRICDTMPPSKQNARDGDGHASVLEISEGRSTSEITELSEVVNGATETAMAAALREALRRKVVAS